MIRTIFSLLLLIIGLNAQTDSLNIYWSPNTEPDISHYVLYRSVNSFNSFTQYQIIDHPDTHAVDHNVRPGQLYAYYLVAVDINGNSSAPSDTVAAGVPGLQLESFSFLSSDTLRLAKHTLVWDPDNTPQQLHFRFPYLKHLMVRDSLDTLYIWAVPKGHGGAAYMEVVVEDSMGLWDSTGVYVEVEFVDFVNTNPVMIQLMPNPARDRVQVKYHLPHRLPSTKIVIYDVLGRIVAQQRIAADRDREIVDVGKLPTGVYFLRIDTPVTSLVKRLLIVH